MYVQSFLAPEAVESEPHARYLPVMITRLMLSLKKAAVSQTSEGLWSFGEPAAVTRISFARPQGRETSRDEISLDSFRNGA